MICSSLILFICQLYHHFEISQQLLSAAGIFKELQPPHSSPPYNPSSVSWSEVSERLSESLSCPGGWRQMVLVSIMYSDDENRITQEPTKGGQIDVNTQLPFCSRSVIQLIVCKCLLNVSFWESYIYILFCIEMMKIISLCTLHWHDFPLTETRQYWVVW